MAWAFAQAVGLCWKNLDHGLAWLILLLCMVQF
jgi:hypothetical protein